MENHLLNSDTFEMIFQWNNEWVSIAVKPFMEISNSQYYIVNFHNDLLVILTINEDGEWEELKEGCTELARHLGKAIRDYYSVCC